MLSLLTLESWALGMGFLRKDAVVVKAFGTVMYTGTTAQEDGFFGLVATNGVRYDVFPALEDHDEFSKNGIAVYFEGVEKKVVSSKPWGRPMDLTHIERIGEIVRGSGHIVYVSEGAGFFGIIADDGKQYRATIPSDYEIEGMAIIFEGWEPVPAVATTSWGQFIKLKTLVEKTSP